MEVKNGDSATIVNFSLYSSFSSMIAGEREDGSWTEAWAFDAEKEEIRLLGAVCKGEGSNR